MAGAGHYKYKYVITSFIIILLVFFWIVVAVIVSHQRDMFTEAKSSARYELRLIGTFAHQALLRHDYATVEEFLKQWGEEHEEIIELKAIAPNNFVMAHYISAVRPVYPFNFRHSVEYAGRNLITLEMTKDFLPVVKTLNKFIYYLITGSVFLVVMLGITIWYTLKKLALMPLEREIAIRREAERKFRTILESAPDAMIFVNREGKIMLINEQAEKLFGYPPEELQGEEIERLMPERFRGIHRKEREGYYFKPKSRPMGSGLELYGIARDGREFPVDISLSPVETEEGVFVLADIRDITERRLAEEKIKRGFYFQSTISSILQTSLDPAPLEEQLEHILDTILSIPFLSLQAKGSIYFMGDIAGDKPDMLIMKAQKGLSEAIIKTCAKVPVGKCLCGLAASTKDIVLAGCTDILHDINYKDMLLHGNFCVPILSGERVLGVMNLLVEEGYKEHPEDRELLTSVAKTLAGIIERKRTEQEKQKLQEQLVQAEKLSALGRLTANVAHEIRNPLTSIGGYARRLNKTAPQSLKEKKYIEVIVSEVDRLERILRNVLTFSREARLNLTSCDINEVINESLRFYEVMCREHSVKTETSLPVLPRIMIDKDMVRETINNIISNALDAMPGGGALTITTEMEPYRKKKYLTVKIADTGKGIPEDKLNMVFEPFFSTKLTGHGTGLGLSICKKIVEDHGGFIRAVSKEGKGSTFSLYFPYEVEGPTGR